MCNWFPSGILVETNAMRKALLPLLFLFILTEGKSQQKDLPIRVMALNVAVQANLFVATTQIDMDLYNPNQKVLDGMLNFSLDGTQMVTGFALDVNGNMRPGVVVDKQKGRVAYENTIRRKIDPGLIESVGGNQYRLRVYPMPSNGIRKVSLTLHQVLREQEGYLHYHLPLMLNETVERSSFHIKVSGVESHPFTGTGLVEGLRFEKAGAIATLFKQQNKTLINAPLHFRIPLGRSSYHCLHQQGNENYFALRFQKPQLKPVTIKKERVTVFWDVSASASKRDSKKELQFLDAFLQQYNPSQLTVVTFSNAVHTVIQYAEPLQKKKSIHDALLSSVHDGGTQLGVLSCSDYNAEEYLLFSDGFTTFGKEKMQLNGQPVHTITSSPASNHQYLNSVAAQTGGQYINLSGKTAAAAIEESRKMSRRFVRLEGEKNVVQEMIPVGNGSDLFIGRLSGAGGRFTLVFRNSEGQEEKESISVNELHRCDSTPLDKALDAAQLDWINRSYPADPALMMEFAKANSVVTGVTSLIVLDAVSDYLDHGIMPPAELMEEYNRQLMVRKQVPVQNIPRPADKTLEHLKAAVSIYNQRINWWNPAETPISLEQLAVQQKDVLAYRNAQEAKAEEVATDDFSVSKSSDLQEVVVVGYAAQRRRDITGSVSRVSASEITQSTNVFTALQGRVAGLNITREGSPGSAPSVTIRGASSGTGNGQPLYILDGVPVDGQTVQLLNTSTIQTITVLKDAGATALYGSRGANGVIVIESKRGDSRISGPAGTPKYKNLEDVDYVQELDALDAKEIYPAYLKMKLSHAGEPAFYFDAAEVLKRHKRDEEAMRVLTNLSEMDAENHQLLRAIGYMLESWGNYEDAISVYEKVFLIKEEEPQSYRDLALALYMNRQYQRAVDLLYASINADWNWYEARYRGLKDIMLNELNAIISLHKDSLDLGGINPAIIRALPVDLRIIIDWNKDETDIDLHIAEPGGETASYNNRHTKSGGKVSEDFTQGYGPEEYEIKSAHKGRYRVAVNYYGDRYQKQQVPSFIKVTTFRNFGRPGQTMKVQTLIMEGQSGMIEIDVVKY